MCGSADSWLVRPGTRSGGDAMDEDEGGLHYEVPFRDNRSTNFDTTLPCRFQWVSMIPLGVVST